MSCKTCGHYELKKMINSGKPFGYSGDIPCFRCSRYQHLEDEHTNPSATEKERQNSIKCGIKSWVERDRHL